jgi:hypothetical protein
MPDIFPVSISVVISLSLALTISHEWPVYIAHDGRAVTESKWVSLEFPYAGSHIFAESDVKS